MDVATRSNLVYVPRRFHNYFLLVAKLFTREAAPRLRGRSAKHRIASEKDLVRSIRPIEGTFHKTEVVRAGPDTMGIVNSDRDLIPNYGKLSTRVGGS